jgi:putative transposase
VPRSPRVEYGGARYHVLNRGNYRQDLFVQHRSGEKFVEALSETCERYGWVLHAYVVMSNHYHLAVETPLANLSAGMQYLQSVFSNRFNRFVGEGGHVFQGRYKALVLEGATALLQVVDYIHLNPVRAGLVKVDELKAYGLSSFPRFFRTRGRPAFLRAEDFLHEAGGLTDSPAGMAAYHRRLKLVLEEDPGKRDEEFRRLCRGWYIGSGEGKAALAGQIQGGKVAANAEARREVEEHRWEALLEAALRALGKTELEAKKERKGAEWKLAVGAWLKGQSGVGNEWLARRLNMGHPQTASRQMILYKRGRLENCSYAKRLEEISKCSA